MQNERISSGRSDGRSSLGKFDDKGSFGEAFRAAHSAGGSGHTFTYKGKLYTTDCKDGGDYRKTKDNRGELRHRISGTGHAINAFIKDKTGIHIQDHILMRGYKWSADVDRQRAEYHKREIIKLNKKIKKK